MLRAAINKIIKAVSGERAFTAVKEISNFHRIQASTGYRAAAQHVHDRLKAAGLETRILSFDARADKWYLSSKMFQEWDCKGGKLNLVAPEERVLADYSVNMLSICPKSYPADFRDTPVDVVLLEHGADREAYKDLDARGKILFIRGHVSEYMDWAIQDTGAIGLITDFMREIPGIRSRYDLIDTLNYISFWWKHTPEEPKVFGFTLSPREGDKLVALCRKMTAEHAKDPSKPAYPQVTGYVDSSLYDGKIEVVETYLPGQIDEELLVTAHLCHPRSSANDNASGVSAGMEIFQTLRHLISSGQLPPLKRGIRMIFIPEFSGTYPYLEYLGAEGRKRIKAGLNLDMVGARQTGGYGPLTISGVPHALPTIVMDVAELVLDEVRKTAPSLARENVPMFNSTVVGFEGGSDHFILSDPTIGIPTPMLGQWPDPAYHTSSDSIDVIDPFVLHKSASIAAGYLYTLANLKEEDLGELLVKSREIFIRRLSSILSKGSNSNSDPDALYQEYLHSLRYAKDCLRDYESYFTQDPAVLERVKLRIYREVNLFEIMAENLWRRYTEDYSPDFVYHSKEAPEEYSYVPVRKYIGPVNKLDDYCGDDAELKAAHLAWTKGARSKLRSGHSFDAVIQYNIDGKRNLFEIAREAILEMQEGSVEYVHEYVQLLIKFNLVEIRK